MSEFVVSGVVTTTNNFIAIGVRTSAGTLKIMDVRMTSSKTNTFRVTGPLWGESIGHRWIPPTKASDAVLWCFLWSVPEQKRSSKQLRRRWFESPSRSLWVHYNVSHIYETGSWRFELILPGDTIWPSESWSTLIHFMACHLTVASHNLYQWGIVKFWRNLSPNIIFHSRKFILSHYVHTKASFCPDIHVFIAFNCESRARTLPMLHTGDLHMANYQT